MKGRWNSDGAAHTVEQMLIFLLVIKVSRVLLDLVHTECAGIYGFGPKIVVLELAINLPFLFALGVGGPNVLDVLATHDMVPLMVGPARMGLGLREEVCLVKGLWKHHGDFIPDLPSFRGEPAESFLQVLERVGPALGGDMWELEGLLSGLIGR
jgi:hypothetical protein